MSSNWPIWLIGCIVLLGAGFATALIPRYRARTYTQKNAWSAAHAAIDSATISRDASTIRIPEAEQLLSRAEGISAARGGRDAARTATEYAERANRLWQAATGDDR